MKLDGTLIAAFGRQYEVRTTTGEILLCDGGLNLT